ncbi:hypothetical protein [Vibrio europaeus]|uniref:hypothetical protein n=1 Tax=Vibrio europaeus TaxID=300876 RepID=UPI00233EF3F7|nr:hypothetical protein [Vibrio europaeus]MDC5852969.1 hypothetical protein [Vibrio europaeus]
MYQNNRLPIKELNELLADFDQHQQHNTDTPIFDIVTHTEANYVSELLLNLKLKSPKLTREFVRKLQSGEASWETIDGNNRHIAQSFDFDLLEELGIIYFEDDWLRVSAMLPNSNQDEYIHDTIKPLLNFSRSLKDIIYSRNGFKSVVLGIDKEKYSKIIPNNYLFEKITLNLVDNDDQFHIELTSEDREFDNLVSSYYWKKIINSNSRVELLDRYKEIKFSLPDLVALPNASILTIEEKKIFSEICINIINTSQLLNFSFERFQKILQSHRHFDASIIARTTHININLGVGGETSNSKENTTSTPLSIDEVRDHYNSRFKKHTRNNIELSNLGNHIDHLIFHDGEITSALLFLIKSDLFFDYQKIRSREYTSYLLEKSKENETLRHYLINVIPNYLRDNIYELYLLSREDEFEFGILNLINRVKRKYTSNEVSYSEVKLNVSRVFSEVIIKVAMLNKECELASVIVALAKNYVGQNRDANEFEKLLVENILDHLTPDEFTKLSIALIERLKNISVSGVWPYYTIYLLFKFSDVSMNRYGRKLEEVSLRLRREICLEYEKYFTFSLTHDSHCLNSDDFFDGLNWDVCNDELLIDSFLKLKPSNRELVNGFFLEENKNAIYYMQSIRSYIQVLINLHSLSNANKNIIQSVLIDIVKNVGFKSKDVQFPLFVSHFSDEKYDLWSKFTKIANDFDEAAFNEIMLNISESAPLDAMMSLYSNASKQERKNKIIDSIEKRNNWKLDEDSLPAIEKSFLLALEGNKLDVANVALNAAKDFIENHPWRKSERFKEIIEKWSVFEYKYKILTIFYSSEFFECKVKLINEISEPELEPQKHYHHNRNDWHKEVDLFRRYIIGLIKQNDNPESSYEIFEQLYREYSSSMFSHLVFTSKLQLLIKNDAEYDSYKSLIKEYEVSQSNFNIDMLSLNNKSDYLYALFLSGNHNEVDSECSKLVPSEKFHRSITITYCKSLRAKGNLNAALKLLEEYKKYHSVELNDQELEHELNRLKVEIENSTTPLQKERIKSQVLFSNKSNDELRMIYNEIVRKPVSDLAKIVSNDSETRIESFLYNNVFACLKEILKRGRNLEKLVDKKDENAINDWFTSLFNQRMASFSIELSDQARIGSAESDKNVGETDGLIRDSNNSSISMFEALNLKYIDKTVINKHLNKITKYDRESVSSIFIVSYCYFDKFTDKVNDYCEHIKKEQYNGFDVIDTKKHKLERLERASEYYCTVESRFRGGKEIFIYHLLIDMSLPQNSDN